MTELDYLKPNISYNDFSKLDLRVGKIINAETVKDSKKLLKLLIDFGSFQRQVIAGIGTKYKPEDLINKQVPVIINMEPRKLMGLESQGMILAIGDEDVDALLFPSVPVKEGSIIR
ncbi:MAG TPA: methionine--tRNA ligase subunit beta [archaeon]|jgi:methionine--tRNA ligase beta chain|nr:methionine--tRNA ligase subunit beta [archaeon]HPC10037.1 methionine--tRNA ligase subunit beta [archaeon]HRT02485.1 methionine--tRNA ligase subunit beta [Candidatus Diapherotrites archaeon]